MMNLISQVSNYITNVFVTGVTIIEYIYKHYGFLITRYRYQKLGVTTPGVTTRRNLNKIFFTSDEVTGVTTKDIYTNNTNIVHNPDILKLINIYTILLSKIRYIILLVTPGVVTLNFPRGHRFFLNPHSLYKFIGGI